MNRLFLVLIPILVAAWLPAPAAGVVPAERELSFKAYMSGRELGHHRLTFSDDNGAVVVDIDIQFRVRIAGITVFRYEHRNREVYHDDRLVALDAKTNDDGERSSVIARIEGDALRVEGTQGRHRLPLGTLATTYWHIAILRQKQIFDSQSGRLVDLVVTDRGRETITARGKKIEARRHNLKGGGFLDVDVWYDAAGVLVSLAFHARGNDVTYVLQ